MKGWKRGQNTIHTNVTLPHLSSWFIFSLSHCPHAGSSILYSVLAPVLDFLSCLHCLTEQFLSSYLIHVTRVIWISFQLASNPDSCGLSLIWPLIRKKCRGHPRTVFYLVWLPQRVTVTTQAHLKCCPLKWCSPGLATVCTLTNCGQEMSWVQWNEGTL